MSQEVNTYSIYDTNQSGDLTVSDVTEVVDNIKKEVAATSTQQYVTADDLKTLISTFIEKLNNLELQINTIQDKLGIQPVSFENITANGQTYHVGTSGAIDLGLSVKWSACNLGATSPGEYGDYFAWGETEPYYTEGHAQDAICNSWKNGKSGYKWASYFDSATGTNFVKYATNKELQLDGENDAAHKILGHDWRMPTMDELNELRNKCIWTWAEYENQAGYIVVGTNGNAIFLPAAGYRTGAYLYETGKNGKLWSASLDSSRSGYAYDLSYDTNVNWASLNRCYGLSVRPVCP